VKPPEVAAVYVVAVTVFVKPEFVAPFIEASFLNAAGSRGEPGNVRWDFCQAEDDPSRFLLYEVYKSKADFVAHQQTPHYLRWRDAVTDWMAQPRQGVKHTALFYGDERVASRS
jgi:autoinducer 2-degrading protein